eukprot:3231227-Alexandrium_andersonii.AAC.1
MARLAHRLNPSCSNGLKRFLRSSNGLRLVLPSSCPADVAACFRAESKSEDRHVRFGCSRGAPGGFQPLPGGHGASRP